MTLILRFMLGAALAGFILLWCGLPFLLNILIAISVGIISAVWGDRFLLGLMSGMRYLR
jgi:hypothetical protein